MMPSMPTASANMISRVCSKPASVRLRLTGRMKASWISTPSANIAGITMTMVANGSMPSFWWTV
jgi:hypothetical protein